MAVTEIATFYRKCPSCPGQFGEWLVVINSNHSSPDAVRVQRRVLSLELLPLLPCGPGAPLLLSIEAFHNAHLLPLTWEFRRNRFAADEEKNGGLKGFEMRLSVLNGLKIRFLGSGGANVFFLVG